MARGACRRYKKATAIPRADILVRHKDFFRCKMADCDSFSRCKFSCPLQETRKTHASAGRRGRGSRHDVGPCCLDRCKRA